MTPKPLTERLRERAQGSCYTKDKAILDLEAADEIERLRRELADSTSIIGRLHLESNEVSAAIGSTRYMDLPDGGDVTLGEQARRLREEFLQITQAEKDRLRALLREAGEAAVAILDEHKPSRFAPGSDPLSGDGRVTVKRRSLRTLRAVLDKIKAEGGL